MLGYYKFCISHQENKSPLTELSAIMKMLLHKEVSSLGLPIVLLSF